VTEWLTAAALLVLLAVAAFAIWRAFQMPGFVAGLAAIAAKAAAKEIVTKVTARMSSEEEAEMQREHRAGRGDEYLRNRQRRRRASRS
jgi:hypothetical protein